MTRNRSIQDRPMSSRNGFVVLALQLLLMAGAAAAVWAIFGTSMIPWVVTGILEAGFFFFMVGGYYSLEPNQAQVMSFFGDYVGTVEETGLRWSNPLYGRVGVSMRAINFESNQLKVNDKEGNPIEIAAVVVWHVEDAASALLAVDNYQEFIGSQAESALRSLASSYSYDNHGSDEPSLRDTPDEIALKLKDHIQDRLEIAGIRIDEARLSHLAYAPEIAQSMLQRQQAQAVVAARTLIVQGAVGMVKLALEQLKTDAIVDLDDERKAQMVSNLLVVLCGDRGTQPVINAGSIHS